MIEATETRPPQPKGIAVFKGDYGLTYIEMEWSVGAKVWNVQHEGQEFRIVDRWSDGYGVGTTTGVLVGEFKQWLFQQKYAVTTEHLQGQGVAYVVTCKGKVPIKEMPCEFNCHGMEMLDRYSNKVEV